MKKLLFCLLFTIFLTGIAQSQSIGLSFFYADASNTKEAMSFGVTFDMVWIVKDHISIGADWGVFQSNKISNLIGWSIHFHPKVWEIDNLFVPIGYDFINQRFYIGLGGRF